MIDRLLKIPFAMHNYLLKNQIKLDFLLIQIKKKIVLKKLKFL